MKKILLIITSIFLLILTKQVFSLEKGKWSFVKDDDWCYIGSLPLKSDLPENLKAIVKHDFTYAPDLLKTNKLTLNVLDDVLISLLILGPLKKNPFEILKKLMPWIDFLNSKGLKQ